MADVEVDDVLFDEAVAEFEQVADLEEDEDVPDPTLENLIHQKDLKWLFVGGKGGVGKTTTSCAIGTMLAKHRKSVLIISTDPAHNLSDAFSQKFGPTPMRVKGINNLFCMEVDPKASSKLMKQSMGAQLPPEMEAAIPQDMREGFGALRSMMADMSSSIPGIDEAISFAELMKTVNSMQYSVIVFDTAPTGHTLRLLSFPRTLQNTFGKMLSLKDKFSGLLAPLTALMGGASGAGSGMLKRFNEMVDVVKQVNAQFKDNDRTSFVCVCIPEFLSLYETERLVQELTKFEIDTHCVVVNQVLFPERASACPKFNARRAMQMKYLEQIYDLYEDFNIVEMPLLNCEVRGVAAIQTFAHYLLNPYALTEEGRPLATPDEKLVDHFYDYFLAAAPDRAAMRDELITAVNAHYDDYEVDNDAV